eukprot:990155-Amphidinium_carterae.1
MISSRFMFSVAWTRRVDNTTHASRNAAHARADGLTRRHFRSLRLVGLDKYKCDHRVRGCAR